MFYVFIFFPVLLPVIGCNREFVKDLWCLQDLNSSNSHRFPFPDTKQCGCFLARSCGSNTHFAHERACVYGDVEGPDVLSWLCWHQHLHCLCAGCVCPSSIMATRVDDCFDQLLSEILPLWHDGLVPVECRKGSWYDLPCCSTELWCTRWRPIWFIMGTIYH